MFERYTEKARRLIFFARYEASQFGSPSIETEHLLLGLLREDKALAHQFLGTGAAVEAVRKQIDQRTTKHEKVSTLVDLPLSDESKRVLAFAAEESESLGHKHIEPAHLLLGLLREERSFGAQLLSERGLRLPAVRDAVAASIAKTVESARETRPVRIRRKLVACLAELQTRGGITVFTNSNVGSRVVQFVVYQGTPLDVTGSPLREAPESGAAAAPVTPQAQVAALLKQIRLIIHRMENAVANHDFEESRRFFYEERKFRLSLDQLRKEHNLAEPTAPVPFVCIEMISKHYNLYELQRCV